MTMALTSQTVLDLAFLCLGVSTGLIWLTWEGTGVYSPGLKMVSGCHLFPKDLNLE